MTRVVFHHGDRVTEGAHSGLAILKDGVFCTPPADNLIPAEHYAQAFPYTVRQARCANPHCTIYRG